MALGIFSAVVYAADRTPKVYKEKKDRLSLAILPIDIHSRHAEERRWTYDALLAAVVTTNRFRIVERVKIDRILAELSLGRSELADPKHVSRIGKIVAADVIVSVSLFESGGSSKIVAKSKAKDAATD